MWDVVSERVYGLRSWQFPPATKRAFAFVVGVLAVPSLVGSTFKVIFICDGMIFLLLITFFRVRFVSSRIIAGPAISGQSFIAFLAVACSRVWIMSVCEIKLSRSGAFLILDGLEYGIEIGGVCMSPWIADVLSSAFVEVTRGGVGGVLSSLSSSLSLSRSSGTRFSSSSGPEGLTTKFSVRHSSSSVSCLGSLILAERSATVCARQRSEKYFKDRVQWIFSVKRKNVSSQLVFN